ncbi:MAG: MBL fold metallo-hydrolase [Ginsengibacter sp.]
MKNNRREFIRRSCLISGITALNIPTAFPGKHEINKDGDRLVLLGTQGGPFINSYTQTPSANLIVHNNIPFVIDTGYGVTFKLKDAGINLADLQYIFITHHHSDHNLELGPLLYNSWIAGLANPVHVYGPTGLDSLLKAYWNSNQLDIEIRIANEGRPDIRTLVVPHEITNGIVMSNSTVEVSAFKNIHPPVENSYAYKFKLGGKTVVFSGDTAYCPALATFASGADYLIHEIVYVPAIDAMIKRRPKNAANLKASILSHHTPAEDVGRIATASKVKNCILNHFIPADDKTITDEIWIKAVENTFSGKIIVGKDMLQLAL